MPTPQPSLFIAHGSPMNAIEDNAFTRELAKIGERLRQNPPKSILVCSAHWPSRGQTLFSSAERPPTLCDFFGFPPELGACRYPAPGSPSLAAAAAGLAGGALAERGFDHGAWAPLMRLFPQADIPAVSMSLDLQATPAEIFETGRRLAPLLASGTLFIASGNVSHNLSALDWRNAGPEPSEPWAMQLHQAALAAALDGAVPALADYRSLPGSAQGIPAPADHYLPLLAACGAGLGKKASVLYDGFELGTLSLLSLAWQPDAEPCS